MRNKWRICDAPMSDVCTSSNHINFVGQLFATRCGCGKWHTTSFNGNAGSSDGDRIDMKSTQSSSKGTASNYAHTFAPPHILGENFLITLLDNFIVICCATASTRTGNHRVKWAVNLVGSFIFKFWKMKMIYFDRNLPKMLWERQDTG